MVIESRWQLPIPNVSLPQWVFGSTTEPLRQNKTFLDAADPHGRFVTFAGYRHLSKRFAVGLQQAGLRAGDRVLMCSPNGLYFPVVFMGTVMAGGIFTGASPTMVVRELAYQLRDSGAVFVIAHTQVLDMAGEAASQVGLSRERVFAFEDHLTAKAPKAPKDTLCVRSWSSLLASAAAGDAFTWTEPADAGETTCCINYSSGTTGLPKGVEISHRSYVANGMATSLFRNPLRDEVGERMESSTVVYMPLYHAAAQTAAMAAYPRHGDKMYIMPRFDLEKMLQYTQDYGATNMALVPPVAVLLAKHPLARQFDLGSVREIGCGAAPLSADVQAAVAALWPPGQVEVRQAWGMTELTCQGSGWHPDNSNVVGSVGELVPNALLRLVSTDGSGREIKQADRPGELWFAGPTVMRRYWRNEEATRQTLVKQHGRTWLRTGDVGYVDRYAPGARIFILDRIKELIKVKGLQVAPAELEAVLLENDKVTDAGVVGVPIDGDECPRAYVVLAKGESCTAKELAGWVEGRVSKHKRLTGGVRIVDAIPKSPVSYPDVRTRKES